MEEKQDKTVSVIGDGLTPEALNAVKRAAADKVIVVGSPRRVAPIVAALSAMAMPFAGCLPGLSLGPTPNKYKPRANGVQAQQGPETRQQRRARERAERKKR